MSDGPLGSGSFVPLLHVALEHDAINETNSEMNPERRRIFRRGKRDKTLMSYSEAPAAAVYNYIVAWETWIESQSSWEVTDLRQRYDLGTQSGLCDHGSKSDSFRYFDDPFEGYKLREGVKRSEVDDANAPVMNWPRVAAAL
ncbi:hypothetical protein E4U58_000104 [Claviceps cyperi]|nr:hypothetical protein E4U58_000104 [Claviceps cyperi]